MLTDAQQEAVKSLDENVLVAAGAGSGKTMVLVERVIENLRRNPDLKVSDLMAVTYTRKAAEEMRIRLKARIRQLSQSDGDTKDERWMRAIGEVDSAHIGTIHSLCQSILRTFPVECRVDPQFEAFEEEELEQAEILDAAIQQALRELMIDEDPGQALLLNYPFEELQKWLSKVIKEPLQFDEALAAFNCSNKEEFNKLVNERLKITQRRLLGDLLQASEWRQLNHQLQERGLTDPSDKIEFVRQEALERLAQVAECLGTAFVFDLEASDVSQIWAHALFIKEIDLRIGGRGEEAKLLKETFKNLRALVKEHIGDLPASAEQADTEDWHLLNAVINLVKRARVIYEQKKKEAQKLDFNDLIWRANEALASPDSPVRRYYQSKLKEILVDEFQDTNRMQARLLASMAGPGTRLFLIGDDKQSIYKFQGADVSIFNEWHKYFSASDTSLNIGDLALSGKRRLLSLGESFRSHPGIVHFVNLFFERLLEEDISIANYRANFRPLVPALRSLELESAHRVELINFSDDDIEEKTKSACLEAELVSDWINEKIDCGAAVMNKDGSSRPIKFGDFTILVQRNQDFAFFEPTLAARNIPYVTVGGKTFLTRQEVYDLENLLEFLANPTNDHALLGVLRSPLCALPDDVLHNMASGRRVSLWSCLLADADGDVGRNHLVVRACNLLQRFLAYVPTKTLGELVRSIVTSSSYDLVLLGTPDGRQSSRNLWKIVDLAERYEHMTCGEFVHHLKKMEELQVRQSNAPLETGNAVKLMTIHRAKGLEFPAVILPRLNARVKSKKQKLIFHHQFGVAIDSGQSKDDPKPLWYALASVMNDDMDLAEKKRLLYVAMTRAKDYLAVFLQDAIGESESLALWLRDFLAEQVPGHAELEAGSHAISLANGRANMILRKVSTEYSIAGGAKCSKADVDISATNRNEGAESIGVRAVNYELLEPLESEFVAPPIAGSPWSRVSRRDSLSELDPRLVGNFFHMLMECLPADLSPMLEESLATIAMSLGDNTVHTHVLVQLIEAGRSMIQTFYESELYKIMKAAQSVLRELPYHKLDDGLVENRPDLLIKRDDDNWLIVDFKTDKFPAEKMDEHARLYRRQLKNYQDDLLAIAGIRAETALYFARSGHLYKGPVGN